MDWDMLIVTGALFRVLMLIAILGRIWQDQTRRRPSDASPEKRVVPIPPVELDKVAGQENSLA